MGGLMASASAARAAAGSQTIMGGKDSDPEALPPQRTTYADEPPSLPVKFAYADTPAPTRPVLTDEQTFALSDTDVPDSQRVWSAPTQESYPTQNAAVSPGRFDRDLAAYKEQRGFPGESRQGLPFARVGANTEENPQQDFGPKEAAPNPGRQQQLALNSKEPMPDGSGFGQAGKPQDSNADQPLRVAQNAAVPQISDVTPEGFKKHPGEIWIEKKWPKVNAIIEREAEAAGVNHRWLKIMAYLESSGNPLKENGSYIGLFQFDPRPGKKSWEKYGNGGNIRDATDSTRAMIRAMKDYDGIFNRETFRQEFRLPTLPELFLIHNQGPTGSRALRRNPDEIAWKALVRAGMSEAGAKEHIGKNVSDIRAGNLDRLTSRQVLEYKFAGGEGYGNWFMPKSYDVTIDKDGVAKDLSPWWPAQGPEQNKASFTELSGEEARRLSRMRDTISTYLQAPPRRTRKLPEWPDPRSVSFDGSRR